jgi:hypothetical protein
MENPANKKMKGPFRPEILGSANDLPESVQKFYARLNTAVHKVEMEDFAGLELDAYYDDFVSEMIIEFRTWLYGEELARQEVSYPAGWWQAFKFRWFPGFLKSVWPVEYETVVVEAKILYPLLRKKLSFPDEHHVLHVKKREHGD